MCNLIFFRYNIDYFVLENKKRLGRAIIDFLSLEEKVIFLFDLVQFRKLLNMVKMYLILIKLKRSSKLFAN